MARLAFVTALLFVSAAEAAALATGSQATLGTSAQARQSALEHEWGQELDGVLPMQTPSPETKVVKYKSPIKRVVALLKKMQAELENEAKNESEMYDEMVCWCTTNEKEKTQAIKEAEARDKELSAEAEARSAKLGEQVATIDALKKQIAEDTQVLKQATAMQEGGTAEFSEEEKELAQNIVNVKNAIAVLKKHHGEAALMQLDPTTFASLRSVLRDLTLQHEVMMAGEAEVSLLQTATQTETATKEAATHRALLDALDAHGSAGSSSLPLQFAQKLLSEEASTGKAGTGFLQAGSQALAQQPIFKSYTPQSSQIFGILKQMQEDFEAHLAEIQGDQIKSSEDYQALAAAKKEQIATAKEKLDMIEEENADNIKALSDVNENLNITREQRSKDVEFLQNLKLTCQELDKQWEHRSKTRHQELMAVLNATQILTEDDNMDLLRQTVTFLQVSEGEGSEMRARRARAVSSLRHAAEAPAFQADDLLAEWHGHVAARRFGQKGTSLVGYGPRARLSTLAVSVSLDDFTKVKEMMDKMVAELKEQQLEDVKVKEHCTEELGSNKKEIYETNEEKEDLEATIDKLTKLIETLTGEIVDAKEQINATEVEIQKASQDREKENAEFQTVVADQRATQDILAKALKRLKSFYTEAEGGAKDPAQAAAEAAAPKPTPVPGIETALVQQEPPVKFNSYKKNAGASPVIGLIQQIVEDSKALETEQVEGERKAQATYVVFVQDSNGVIADLTKSINVKTKEKSEAAENLEQAKSDLVNTVGKLKSLEQYEADLHRECDWLLKNFEVRQKARLAEIEAIQAAKGILSGAKQEQ